MKISREWLQTYFEKPLPTAQELAHALTFHAFEIESVQECSSLTATDGRDCALDVKITPNRGHDCLSYRGIAKEVSAILSLSLKREMIDASPVLEPRSDVFKVTIEEPTLCARFTGAVITNITVGPSPQWLVERLSAMGQQSINNVVDATNFVMFSCGQPLHAFDAGKLKNTGGVYAMTVRKARKGETLIGLDEKEYALTDAMLAIADSPTGAILSIAGVKGGISSGITEKTKTLLLEGANWDGVTIRKTSQTLKLRTDASQRFEQVISPEYTAFGVYTATQLILELAGGELVGYSDVYPTPQAKKSVSVSLEHINRLLGTSLKESAVENVFKRLGLEYKGLRNPSIGFEVTVPPERLDITIPEDLIEEVGRIVGYESISATELPPLSRTFLVNQNFATSERVREEFTKQGYSEVFTSVFAEEGKRAVSNKIGGDKPFLRANLTDGLTEALKKNIQNKDLLGLQEVKLFEIGVVWLKDKEVVMVGTVTEKIKAAEKPLFEYVQGDITEYPTLPISDTARFEQFSRYPYIVRDIALWCPKGTEAEAILEDIRHHAGELLVRSALFDTFEKGERVSFAFRLVFQSFDQTLTDEDANRRMESIYTSLSAKGFEIR